MMRSTQLLFRRALHLFVLLAATSLLYAPANAQEKAQEAGRTPLPLRLDTPLTDSNSVRISLYGGVLRVPKFLVGSQSIPSEPDGVVKLENFGFSFWYPDMTPTCYGTLCGPRPAPGAFDPNAQNGERFKVFVTTMAYSPEGQRSPRPSDIFNRETRIVGHPIVTESKFYGLRILDWSEAYKKKNPQYKNPPPEILASSHLYYQKESAPYEIWMICDPSECKARVYSKSHHFEFQFILSETDDKIVARVDEMLNKLNAVIDRWASN